MKYLGKAGMILNEVLRSIFPRRYSEGSQTLGVDYQNEKKSNDL